MDAYIDDDLDCWLTTKQIERIKELFPNYTDKCEWKTKEIFELIELRRLYIGGMLV